MKSEMLRVVDAEGNCRRELEPNLSAEELKELYRAMVYTRVFDVKMLSLQRQGRISFYAPCIGEEAAHIGSTYAVRPSDWIFPQYREPGITLLRGMPLAMMVSQLMGNAEDPMKGRNFANTWGDRALNIVYPSAVVATQIPMAVGTALAAMIRGDEIVTLVFFGDGATSSGHFHSGMNMAGVYKTPTIFVCKNNQYAISTPVQTQTASKSIAVKALAYGLEGVQVDGNDVLAVYRATEEAEERARAGGGPTLIEAVTYRLGPHSTSDDPGRYRSEEEVEAWRSGEPVTRFRRYLERKGVWNDTDEEKLQESADEDISEAIRRAEAAPPPPIESLFEDVYHEMPRHLREQMQQALQEQRQE